GNPRRLSHRVAGDCDRESKSFRNCCQSKWTRKNCRTHALAGATESDWNYHRTGVDRYLTDRISRSRNTRTTHRAGNRAPGSRHQSARRRGLYCFWVSVTTSTSIARVARHPEHQRDLSVARNSSTICEVPRRLRGSE